MTKKKRVLFLCTGNSARSQMAEGLLRQMARDQFDVFSAGTHPKGLHPRSIEVMSEIGIDISEQTSKDVATFVNDRFDYVITVCDRAKQQCPVFPGAEPIHWGFDDPAEAPPNRQLDLFRHVRDEIRRRLNLHWSLLALKAMVACFSHPKFSVPKAQPCCRRDQGSTRIFRFRGTPDLDELRRHLREDA